MNQYTYKGFKVVYEIKKIPMEDTLYRADGYVVPTPNKNTHNSIKFHTEYPTKLGVRRELKKIIKNYIDFEWKEFKEMQLYH